MKDKSIPCNNEVSRVVKFTCTILLSNFISLVATECLIDHGLPRWLLEAPVSHINICLALLTPLYRWLLVRWITSFCLAWRESDSIFYQDRIIVEHEAIHTCCLGCVFLCSSPTAILDGFLSLNLHCECMPIAFSWLMYVYNNNKYIQLLQLTSNRVCLAWWFGTVHVQILTARQKGKTKRGEILPMYILFASILQRFCRHYVC